MTPTKSSHHHDDHLYADGDLHNEDVAHEHSDVNVRALLTFAFGLAAVVAMFAAIALGVFRVFERQAAANDPVMSPLARPAGRLPPEPRLLTNEPQNLRRFRTSESDALKGLDDAKKRLLQQGLPVRADAPTDSWMGMHSQAWGESSSGRNIPTVAGSGSAPSPQPQPNEAVPAPASPAAPKSGGH